MSNPTMTVKQLREALAKIGDKHDDRPVTIWLPGSRVDLHRVMGVTVVAHSADPLNMELLIEGNLRPGSALETDMKNSIGGEIKRISFDELLQSLDERVRPTVRAWHARKGDDVTGVVQYRVEQMDSSSFGEVRAMVYGPGCTYKTLEAATAGPLGDVPSRFAYPFAYWSKS